MADRPCPDGALALQEAGRAKPFDFGSIWIQDVGMEVVIRDGEYTLKSVTWRDQPETEKDV